MNDGVWFLLLVIATIAGITCANLSLRRDLIFKPASDWLWGSALACLVFGFVCVFVMTLD